MLATGSRRVRRRARLVVGSAGLAVVAVIASVVAVTHDPAQEPRPARVVEGGSQPGPAARPPTDQAGRTGQVPGADLGRPGPAQPAPQRRRRIRARAAGPRNRRHGLAAGCSGHDRPPLSHGAAVRRSARAARPRMPSAPAGARCWSSTDESRTWQTGHVSAPAGLEAHAPPSVGIGLDGRLYLGHTNEGTSGPMHWWSYPVPQGGQGRPEPALTGTSIAFGDGVHCTGRLRRAHRSLAPPARIGSWPSTGPGLRTTHRPGHAPCRRGGWGWPAAARSSPTGVAEPVHRAQTPSRSSTTPGGKTISCRFRVLAADQGHVLLAPPSGMRTAVSPRPGHAHHGEGEHGGRRLLPGNHRFTPPQLPGWTGLRADPVGQRGSASSLTAMKVTPARGCPQGETFVHNRLRPERHLAPRRATYVDLFNRPDQRLSGPERRGHVDKNIPAEGLATVFAGCLKLRCRSAALRLRVLWLSVRSATQARLPGGVGNGGVVDDGVTLGAVGGHHLGVGRPVRTSGPDDPLAVG